MNTLGEVLVVLISISLLISLIIPWFFILSAPFIALVALPTTFLFISLQSYVQNQRIKKNVIYLEKIEFNVQKQKLLQLKKESRYG